MNTQYRHTIICAFKTMSPVILGFIPTAMAYGLLFSAADINPSGAILSSIFVFAGSVQFISIELIKQNIGLLQYAAIIFLIHSRHLFYGVSVMDKYGKTGKAKPLMIFWLTDELYAVITSTLVPNGVKEGFYYICAAFLGYAAWNAGTAMGVFASELVSFNTEGLDFALNAMFLVIVIEQMKSAKNKLPFAIGAVTAVVSLTLFGPGSMLAGCAIMSSVLLIAFKGQIGQTEREYSKTTSNQPD